MCIGWVVVALMVVAFWAVPIAAILALFPAGSRARHHRRTGDHD
jgi:ABC-type uncharacterized transport system permease subunit